MHETLPPPHEFVFDLVWIETFKWWYIYYSGLFPWRRPPPNPCPAFLCKMLDLIMVVAVKTDLEGCSGNMQKKKKKKVVPRWDCAGSEWFSRPLWWRHWRVSDVQEGFWFEYRLLHSVRSKLRSDLEKKKEKEKKAASKIIQTKRWNLSTNDPSFSSLLSVSVMHCVSILFTSLAAFPLQFSQNKSDNLKILP